MRTGDLNGVIQWGIGPKDFTLGETKGFFTQFLTYYSAAETMGSVWGPQSLYLKFPHFMLCDDLSMTTEALCTEVRRDRMRVETKQLLKQADALVDLDPVEAIELLQSGTMELRNECTSKKVDVHMADAMEGIWADYCATEQGQRVGVFPWPWEPLQRVTLGARPTDYVIFYGRPKSMKSWVLCFLIAFIIYMDFGYRILIYTKEMSAEELFERVACQLAGVAYENFTSGKMTPEERANFVIMKDLLKVLRAQMVVVCLSAKDVKAGQDTVAWFRAKIRQYRPHVAFVDGMYLMSDLHGAKKKHERVANISQEMRQVVLQEHVPIIATVQANREAAKNEEANTEEVAFSDSLGQDATMLIRIVNEWKKEANTLALVMGGSTRRFHLTGFRIYGMPGVNFGYYGDLTEKDAQNALKKDDGGKEAKGTKPRTITRRATDVGKDATEVAGMINA